MRKIARFRIIVLAMMLAVSHVALISHVTAHFEPNLEQCDLCVSQAQLLTAIPSPDHHFQVESGLKYHQDLSSACAFHAWPTRAYFQRAPPTPSV